MEDNKDFDKDKQGVETQQMPNVPTEGEDDEKKGTIELFGHEFDKRKAVLAGLGGLLAIALIGGGVWYAASQKPEPKEPTPIEQNEKQEQQVIQLGAKADGWVKGESSPVIAHIVNKDEKVDYYHAYDANEPHALDVPAEGEYEVSFISPVDKDGSTYEVPKTAKVKAEAEDEDGKDTGDELPFEFKPIAADKADADALNAIVKSVGDAVKKGDETLTGANGTKVIELVKENAKANPNADKDKVDEEGQKAEEDNTEGAGNAKPDNGGDSEHTHNWVPQTTTIHHDAQYQTIHHDAITEEIYICNNCGANITGDPWGHINDSFLNGDGSCGGYHSEWKVTSPAWDETKEVSPAWDETITTYKCSGCPATK